MLARKLDIRRRMSTLSLSKGLSLFSAAHLPVPKSLSAKPCISITSKLIEIKGLQLALLTSSAQIEFWSIDGGR